MPRLNMSLNEYLYEQEKAEQRLPICDKCGEPIYGGYYWEVENYQMYCQDCAEEWLQSRRFEIKE